MAYAIVIGAALSAGATAYALTMWRSRDRGSFSFDGALEAEAQDGSFWGPMTAWFTGGSDATSSWQARTVGLLGLIALVMVCATAIAFSLYQGGLMLWRLFIRVSP
ncbi:MAG: hypothetical protein ABI828_02385 [Actinomycetota bacterium]